MIEIRLGKRLKSAGAQALFMVTKFTLPLTPRENRAPPVEVTFAFLQDRRLWLLCAIILVSRLALLTFSHWLPGDDGLRYLQEALNLRDFGTFSSDHTVPPAPDTFDLPLFPLLLSGLLRLFPNVSLATRIASAMNAVFFSAACAGLFGIARLLSGRASFALLAVAIFASFPETWPYSLFHMPDSLFLFVFLWSIFLLVSFLKTGVMWKFLFAFGLLAVSTLIKPASIYFGVVFAVWALLFWPGKVGLLRRVGWIVCGFALELVVFSPMIVRNRIDFGHSVLTTITGVNYFRENYRMLLEDTRPAEAKAVLQEQEDAARQRAGAAWSNPVEQAGFLGEIANRELKAHFGSYLVTVAKRHPRLYIGTGSVALLRLLGDDRDTAVLEQWQNRPSLAGMSQIPAQVIVLQLVAWLVLGLAYLAALAGVVELFRRKAWLPLTLNVLPLLYFAAAVGPMTYTRYRMPMAPFFAMLAAYGIFWLRRADHRNLEDRANLKHAPVC